MHRLDPLKTGAATVFVGLAFLRCASTDGLTGGVRDAGTSVLEGGGSETSANPNVDAGDASDAADAFDATPSCIPGTLDPTFGSGGKLVTPFGNVAGVGALAVTSGDSIIAAGLSDGACAVAKYDTTGALDPTFGNGGLAKVQIGIDDGCRAVAVQSDGKIVIGGRTHIPTDGSTKDAFALARFTTTGALDSAFGTAGKVTTDLGGDQSPGADLALQADGKIVVVGWVTTGATSTFALARYGVDGHLDATFGTGGKVTTSITQSDQARSVVVQPNDQKIVVTGTSTIENPGDVARVSFSVARYNPSGTLDLSFGGGGSNASQYRANDAPERVVLQDDGRILIAGESFGLTDGGAVDGGTREYLLARYNTNGTRDNSFGTGGLVARSVTGDESAKGVIFSEGNITAIGTLNASAKAASFGLLRVLFDGGIDDTFGDAGMVATSFVGNDLGRAIAVQSDKKIVVGGSAAALGTATTEFALARYCP